MAEAISASAGGAWSGRSGSGSRIGCRARRRARRATPSSGEIRASVVGRLAIARDHSGQGRFDDADPDPVGDLHFGLVVADLGDPTADAAAGDHVVALLDRRDCLLILLRAWLL